MKNSLVILSIICPVLRAEVSQEVSESTTSYCSPYKEALVPDSSDSKISQMFVDNDNVIEMVRYIFLSDLIFRRWRIRNVMI
jgi:hypothetical protein